MPHVASISHPRNSSKFDRNTLSWWRAVFRFSAKPCSRGFWPNIVPFLPNSFPMCTQWSKNPSCQWGFVFPRSSSRLPRTVFSAHPQLASVIASVGSMTKRCGSGMQDISPDGDMMLLRLYAKFLKCFVHMIIGEERPPVPCVESDEVEGIDFGESHVNRGGLRGNSFRGTPADLLPRRSPQGCILPGSDVARGAPGSPPDGKRPGRLQFGFGLKAR